MHADAPSPRYPIVHGYRIRAFFNNGHSGQGACGRALEHGPIRCELTCVARASEDGMLRDPRDSTPQVRTPICKDEQGPLAICGCQPGAGFRYVGGASDLGVRNQPLGYLFLGLGRSTGHYKTCRAVCCQGCGDSNQCPRGVPKKGPTRPDRGIGQMHASIHSGRQDACPTGGEGHSSVSAATGWHCRFVQPCNSVPVKHCMRRTTSNLVRGA